MLQWGLCIKTVFAAPSAMVSRLELRRMLMTINRERITTAIFVIAICATSVNCF